MRLENITNVKINGIDVTDKVVSVDFTFARKSLWAQVFSDQYYGVRLFEHEDDWGWTVLGHPIIGDPMTYSMRRVIAAMNALARENSVHHELFEAMDFDLRNIQWTMKYVNNIRYCDPESDYITWDDCTSADEGAMPITVVSF